MICLFYCQAYAEKASKNANDIRIQANRTKLEALRLGNEAEILHLRVDTTDSLMKDYEVQVGKDTNVTTEVTINKINKIVIKYKYIRIDA